MRFKIKTSIKTTLIEFTFGILISIIIFYMSYKMYANKNIYNKA